MNRIQAAIVLSVFTVVLTSCGGSGPRTLESISVSPNPATAQNGKAQLVATGTFSSSPVTVTPLAVNWIGPPVPLNNVHSHVCVPGECGGGINTDGLVTCGIGYSGSVTITVSAPKDPTLPLSTPNVPMVTATATVSCPATP
jgi:hypothetical protein